MEGNALENQFDLGREYLKLFAIITMTIDHIGAFLYPEYSVLRIIGRIAFPIFAYLLILGIENTRNKRNYFLRLIAFAAISQIPYFLVQGNEPFELLNIFFTLSFGVMFLVNSLSLLPFLLVSMFVNFDFGLYGIVLIACLRLLRERTAFGILAYVAYSIITLAISTIQSFQLLALPFILLHHTGYLKRTRTVVRKNAYPIWRKYFFYLFYPLHLTILYFIRVGQ
ncbi:MAG: conjugal transfer protein TraX [Candidatus Bathyarchaeota archaeon]|nr:conjugal transfer protein TraX [Candidatus Bathyarchaeota archaeon]